MCFVAVGRYLKGYMNGAAIEVGNLAGIVFLVGRVFQGLAALYGFGFRSGQVLVFEEMREEGLFSVCLFFHMAFVEVRNCVFNGIR